MKLMRQLKVLNLFLVWSLVFSGPANLAYANSFSEGLLQAMQVGTQVTNQALQTYFQQQQNQISQQQLQQAVEGIRVKGVPDRYFPQTCFKYPVSGPDPKQILLNCSSRLNPMQEQALLGVLNSNAALYENSLIKGQSNQMAPTSSAGPVSGVQCIEENTQILEAQLNDRANELRRLITELEKQNEIFKRTTEDEIDAMAKIRAELDGQNPRAKPPISDLDTESLFRNEASCGVVMRKELFLNKQGRKAGLKGLQEASEQNLPAAEKVLNESGLWKSQIEARSSQFKKLITDKGIDAFIKGEVQNSPSLVGSGNIQFGAINGIINNARDELQAKIKGIQDEIDSLVGNNRSVGFPAPKIPALSRNSSVFQRDISIVIREYPQIVKEAFLSRCTDQRVSGFDNMIKALKQKDFEKRKTTASLDYFKRQLLQITNNETLNFRQKMAEIEALEKNTNAKYKNSSGLGEFYLSFTDNRRMKISEVLKEQVNACNTLYTQDIERLGKRTNINTDANKIVQKLKDLQVLEQNAAADISTKIERRLINCEGIGLEKTGGTASSGGSSCDGPKLDPSGPNFCIPQSLECANHVQRCRNFARDQVIAKENALKNRADNFNSVMDQYRSRQNEILERIMAQFNQQKELLEKSFPGIKTEIPESLLVNLPPKNLNPLFQVGLIGVDGQGNVQDLLSNLKAQIKKVETSMNGQAQEIKRTLTAYTQETQQNYSKEKDRWKKIADDCQKQINDQRQAELARHQEDVKKHQDEQKKIGRFCKDLLRFRTGPGCAEEASRLATEAENLTQFLYPGVADQLERYQDVCSQLNNPSTEEEDEEQEFDEKGERHILLQLCDGEDQGMLEALSTYAQSQMDKIEFAINRALQFDFEEEESDTLERTRESRLDYLYNRESTSSRSGGDISEVSTRDIQNYMNGNDSALSSQESRIKNTTEGQLAYVIRKLARALKNDTDLKEGKACEAIRRAAGEPERVSSSSVPVTTSVTDADMKRRIDASNAGSIRKLRQLTRDILRVQKELKRKVRQGRTIAQQSGEKVFDRCSARYSSGRNSSWDAINEGARQGIESFEGNIR